MKLLHTGDLHLGKSLHETSLIEDQKIMLAKLRDEISKDAYAALVIAGDIYDRTIPPAEAVELFSGFLVGLRRDFPDLEICIIPGNHDSAQRLSFADRILGTQRIHIICNPEESFTPIILAKDDENLAIFLLPFLAPGTLNIPKKKGPERGLSPELDFSADAKPILLTQADLAAEASRRFADALSAPELSGIPAVLVAHLFTVNGKESESERIFLGMAERVPPALFARFSYAALGHLHRFQKVTDRMYYSGSPLAYAFDEAGIDKYFLKVDIDCATEGFPVTVTPVPIEPFRKITRLAARFDEFYAGSAFDSHSPDYLEITLTDDALVANPMNLLRPKFPYLLSLKQGSETVEARGGKRELLEDAGESSNDLVTDFIKFEEMLHGNADADRIALFRELLSECSDEA